MNVDKTPKYLVVTLGKVDKFVESAQTFHKGQEKEMQLLIDRRVSSGIPCFKYELTTAFSPKMVVDIVDITE